ncbi:MAG: phage major tail protein, TP901-1 family [Bilifractor sp.]|jgi:TP901-1 family phage major tail protein
MRKNKMNLQLFAEAVAGKRIIYLYRLLSEAATNDAVAMAFTTENERDKSKDADSTITKDGSIRTPSESETEINATSILAKGDTLIDKLETAMDNDEIVEIWEVNLDDPATTSGKYNGKYFQGYVTEIDMTSSAEDMVEVELTFGVNGSGQKGEVTVSDEQMKVASYVFKDTTKESTT